MNILITGGNGFLGSNLAKKFLKKGHQVFIIDRSSNKFSLKNKKAIFIKGDITDFKSLNKLKLPNIDVVLHCAGQPSAALSFSDPELDLKINVLGTLNILRLSKLKHVKKIIFASTFNVYEENKKKPKLSENNNCEAKSLYAVSKLAAENYIKLYSKHYNISWSIIRMFNIFGPGQDPNNKSLGMINIFLNMALEKSTIEVKGSLERFRDFIYVDDVVEGWYKVAISKKSNNQIYNLGSGKKTSIKILLNKISKILNKKLEVIELSGTPGDFKGCFANINKIKKELKFKPKFSLDKGLEMFIKWSNSLKRNV